MNDEQIIDLMKSGIDGKAMLFFIYLAKKAGELFHKNGDVSLVTHGIKTWLILSGMSRTQSNMVLQMIKAELSLTGSVVR